MKSEKENFKIWVNIGMMVFLLVGITICAFLTSRDLFYAIQIFFGTHKNEDISLLYISSFGFEAAILIYAISNKKVWQDYVFVVASCALNTTYLWHEASNKSDANWAYYVSAVIVGCTYPLIVVWLSVLFRGYFWATVDIKEESYKEEIDSENLRKKVSELEVDKTTLKAEVEKLESDKQAYQHLIRLEEKDSTTLVQRENTLVQNEKDLVQKQNALVQRENTLVQNEKDLVQKQNALVQRENTLVQEENALVQRENTLVQKEKGLVQKENALVQRENTLVQKENGLVQSESLSNELTTLRADKKRLEQHKQELIAQNEKLKAPIPVLKMENVELQSNLLRNWKRNKDANETLANEALQEYKKLVESNITFMFEK